MIPSIKKFKFTEYKELLKELEFTVACEKVAGNEFDFSFSGLKTNVINMIHNSQQKGIELNFNNLSASIQNTISEILTENDNNVNH